MKVFALEFKPTHASLRYELVLVSDADAVMSSSASTVELVSVPFKDALILIVL